MKKFIKKFMTICLAFVLVLSAVACGSPDNGQEIDESKTQIYAFAVDNGMGYKWLEHLAKEFNAKPENSDYQVIVQHGSLNLTATLSAQISAETTNINIYFGSQSDIVPMIANKQLQDLSSVYEMKVDGTDKTIGDKTYNFEQVKLAFTDLNGNGIYAIPYSSGVNSMVFDYDMFVKNGYLTYAKVSEKSAIETQSGISVTVNGNKLYAGSAFGNYAEGEVILSAGKDGKYGTYDDGQAQNMAEFKDLLSKIMDDGNSPFIYSTKYMKPYTTPMYLAVMAQSMGYDNYVNFSKLNGEIKGKDGTVQANLTLATGADAWNTDVVTKAYTDALTFYRENIYGYVGEINEVSYTPSQMIHKSAFQTTSLSHTDAQDKFLSGFITGEEIAFLIEGNWFESAEAKTTFESLSAYSTADDPRGYGVRDYRFYLLPTIEGQLTSAEQSIIACQDDGVGVLTSVIPKKLTTQAEKDAFSQKCKEFLAFTLSDQSLVYYTTSTGIPRPYDYSLTSAQYKALTPFQQNSWDVTHDPEHVTVLFKTWFNNFSSVRSVGGLKDYMSANIQKGETNIFYESPIEAFQSVTQPLTVNEYLTGIKEKVSVNYADYYDLAMRSIG